MIKASSASANETITTIVGAVFGKQGQSQDIIPQAMRLGGVSSEREISPSRCKRVRIADLLTDPAVSVFGWGTWLRDNGAADQASAVVGGMLPRAVRELHPTIRHRPR
jgi:hypothetical protein